MFSSPDRRLTIIFLILFFTISPIPDGVAAQSGMNADPSFSVCMAVIVVFMGLFIASFSIYIRYCSSRQSSANSGILSSAQANVAAGGLDQLTIETFPTFTYAEVKVHKIRNEDLECAICLTEFEDTETLRLIPKCDHVFHPECIDAWLESHVTCPVCRAILDMDSVTDQVPDETTVQVQTADETVVQVVCENPQVIAPVRDQNRLPRNGSIKRSRGVLGLGRFRSNSTGHSDVNVERFTLQLPEESRKEIMDRALLNRAKSCTARNGSTAKGSKTGSSKSGRLYKRMGSLDHSKASPFLLRTLSMISRDNNNSEGSSSKGLKSTVMIPSIKCFDPKPTNEFNNVMVDPV